MSTRIQLEDGKYTVIHDNGANFHALRYNKPWRDLTGDGLVLAMAQKIEDLLAELDSLKLALNMIDAADWQCGADATDNQISMAKGSLIRQMKRIASAALQGEQL